jgi:hypothetical protein
MRFFRLGMLLASLPLAQFGRPVWAQQGSILDQRPFKSDSFFNPQVIPPPPDDTVTSTPLPPPDQGMAPNDQSEAPQEMVPNPLQDPNAIPVPGQAPGQAQSQVQVQRGSWVQMGTATLQALDKVNARSNTLVVRVGDVGHFGSLDIAVRGCFVRTADRPADATAFLIIRDQRGDTAPFSGWMVRSAPYMSMLANPIYDVRVAGCTP